VITLEHAAALASDERGLVVISTLRPSGSIQSSLVNAGVLAHPCTGETILGLVTAGKVKLRNLRARPQITPPSVTAGSGPPWKAAPNSPDPTTRNLGLMLNGYGFSAETSARRIARPFVTMSRPSPYGARNCASNSSRDNSNRVRLLGSVFAEKWTW
jgi:hypothetical protein